MFLPTLRAPKPCGEKKGRQETGNQEQELKTIIEIVNMCFSQSEICPWLFYLFLSSSMGLRSLLRRTRSLSHVHACVMRHVCVGKQK